MVYMFLADGFEEAEAITPLDLLKRAGINIKTVSVTTELLVRGTHDIFIQADMLIDDISLDENLQMIVLPGGMPGVKNLDMCQGVHSAIDYCVSNNIFIGAICAAPSILGKKGVLNGKKATCFPGFEEFLQGSLITKSFVETDGKIITAKGMGVADDFGFELITSLKNKQESDKIKIAIQSNKI